MVTAKADASRLMRVAHVRSNLHYIIVLQCEQNSYKFTLVLFHEILILRNPKDGDGTGWNLNQLTGWDGNGGDRWDEDEGVKMRTRCIGAETGRDGKEADGEGMRCMSSSCPTMQ